MREECRASWIAAGFVSSSRKRVNRKTAKVRNLACQARQSTRSSSLSWRDSGRGFDHLICNFPQPCLTFVDRSHDGLSRWLLGKKYGFIDRNGKTVIPPQFDLTKRLL